VWDYCLYERIYLNRKYRLRCARKFLAKRFHEKSEKTDVLSVRISGYFVRPDVRSVRSISISPCSSPKIFCRQIIRQFENVNLKPRIRYFFLPEARARCSLFRVALSSILALDTLFDNPRHISQEKSTFGSHSTPPHRSGISRPSSSA